MSNNKYDNASYYAMTEREYFAYSNNEGRYTKIDPFNGNFGGRPTCGLFAGIDREDCGAKAGQMFVVVSGPVLVPVYHADGSRVHVGPSYAGMSFSKRYGWYNE